MKEWATASTLTGKSCAASLCNFFQPVTRNVINPAIKYLKVVIPAKAGIQDKTECRIKSGMTWLFYLVAGLIIFNLSSL
jgi:hypothetical protein